MGDVWSETLHTCTFAGLELDCVTARDSIDRALVRNSILHRSGGTLHDLGGMPRETDCQLWFFEKETNDATEDANRLNHIERFQAFINATQRGIAQEFTHPITGTYNAKVEGVSTQVNAAVRDLITVDCVFVEDAVDPDPFETLEEPGNVGVSAVRVRVAELEDQLMELGATSTVPAEALAAVNGWTLPDISAREIDLQLQSLTQKIADAQSALSLTADADTFSAWVSFQNLMYELRTAAQSFRQQSPTLFAHTFVSAVPLLTWVSAIYGASRALDMYEEIREINDIDDTSLIREGTVLKAPPATLPGRQGLRSAPR